MPKQSPLQASAVPLLYALDSIAIPSAMRWGWQRVVVAAPTWKEFSQNKSNPEVRISRTKLKSRSVPLRGHRRYANLGLTTARWPEDRLIASRVPALLCVLDGQLDCQCGDYIVHCGAGHFLLLPPGTPHPDGSRPHLEKENRRDGHCDLLWIKPIAGGIECWICHSRGEAHWGHNFGEQGFILNREAGFYMEALVREAMLQRVGSEQIGGGLLTVLLTLLHRELEASNGRIASLTGGETFDPRAEWQPIAYARDYIRLHLNESLTIDQVARAGYLSRAQFTKRFRKETGQSFVGYVTQCRLQEARNLLRDTEWSIKAVGDLVGLKSSYLRELFLRHEGVSPGEFRSRSRGPTAVQQEVLEKADGGAR